MITSSTQRQITTEATAVLNDEQVDMFLRLRARGQRAGQAFFNVLSSTDQNDLRGSIHDPFLGDDAACIRGAAAFLARA